MYRLAAGVFIVALLSVGLVRANSRDDVVIGKTSTTTSRPLPGPTITLPPPDLGRAPIAEPASVAGLKGANGRPYGRSLSFRSDIPVPGHLVFVLVAGSDARPREDVRRTRADSLHLLAINPRTLQGTILGIPRDAWVEIPGRGEDKINQALVRGGPDLLAETMRHLTGLPIHYYVLTGFQGLSSMVDELGGVDVFVDRRMNDPYSGARFDRGWHHFNGAEALAFSRNRHDTANGDFDRSANQGKIILAALAKMRAEVADDNGVEHWIGVLLRHVSLDVPAGEVRSLAALGRRLEPDRVQNAVVPGKVGNAKGQSVVFLGDAAAQVFLDLREDAVIGGAGPEVEPETTTTTEGTTTEGTTTTTDRPLVPVPTATTTTTSTTSTTTTTLALG